MKSSIVKYQEAVGRNIATFRQRYLKPSTGEIDELANSSLEEVKIRIGIRGADPTYDTELTEKIEWAQGVVAAAEKALKKEKKEEKKTVAEKTETKTVSKDGQQVLDQTKLADAFSEIAKAVKPAKSAKKKK